MGSATRADRLTPPALEVLGFSPNLDKIIHIGLTIENSLTRFGGVHKELAAVCDITDLEEWKKKKADIVRNEPPNDPLMDMALAVSNQSKILRDIVSNERAFTDFIKDLTLCQKTTIEQIGKLLGAISAATSRIETLEQQLNPLPPKPEQSSESGSNLQ